MRGKAFVFVILFSCLVLFALTYFGAPSSIAVDNANVSAVKPPVNNAEKAAPVIIAEPIVKKTPIYIVQKGDSLSWIAAKNGFSLQALLDVNPSIKNPNKIRPGQRIRLEVRACPPAKKAVAKSTIKSTKKGKIKKSSQERKTGVYRRSTQKNVPVGKIPGREIEIIIGGEKYIQIIPEVNKIYVWKKPGRRPYGNHRKPEKAIGWFNLPREVKEKMCEAIRKESGWLDISNGMFINELSFTTGIVRNAVASWNSNKLYAARYWLIPHGDFIYVLIKPEICCNWAWIKVKRPPVIAKPPVKAEPPTIIVVPPCEPPKKEEKPPILIPPTREKPQAPEKPAAPPKPAKLKIEPDLEADLWAGKYWSKGGESRYAGGLVRFWIIEHLTPYGKMHEGIEARVNAYDGHSNGFEFSGRKIQVGPAVDINGNWNDGQVRNAFRVVVAPMVGQRTDWGNSENKRYDAKQKTDIVGVSIGNDLYFPKEPIYKISNYIDFNADVHHKKESTFDGTRINEQNDPAGNKTEVAAGSRLYFYRNNWMISGAIVEADHAAEDHHVGVNTGLFVGDPRDIFKAEVKARYVTNSKYENNNNKFSIGVGLNLDSWAATKIGFRNLGGNSAEP